MIVKSRLKNSENNVELLRKMAFLEDRIKKLEKAVGITEKLLKEQNVSLVHLKKKAKTKSI